MNIKNIDNFSIEECREYLNMYPNGPERSAVEDRLRKLQEYLTKDVKWLDIRQFLSNHKYRKLSVLKKIILIPLIISIFLFSASIYFSETEHEIYSGWCDVQAGYTTGVERLLLEKNIIRIPGYVNGPFPCYRHYEIDYNADETVLIILCGLLCVIILIIIHFSNSPSLPYIYNIEQEEKIRSVRRTQNRAGMFGLHLCKKRRIIQLLPFEYDNIYYCGGESYICVKGRKKGVYNTAHKKMVINIECDNIEIMKNGELAIEKDGVHSKLTTDGYRIVE